MSVVDKNKKIPFTKLVNRLINYLGCITDMDFQKKYGINRKQLWGWRNGRINNVTLLLMNIIIRIYKLLSVENRMRFNQELKGLHVDKIRPEKEDF